jgi:Tropinone reductase 1
VEELARLGARVFTCARTQTDVDQALARWRAAGLAVEGCVADLSDATSRTQLRDAVRRAFGGKLNILGGCCPLP